MSADLSSVAARIRGKLNDALSPSVLEVIDESHLHAGHAGASPAGQSHFRIVVVSEQFEGEGRVARQRRVNNILSEELAGPVHALAMKTMTPGEAEAER